DPATAGAGACPHFPGARDALQPSLGARRCLAASTSEAEPGEAAPIEAAIAGEQPCAADHGMSADHEVGHDPVTRTAAAAVAEERLAGDVNRWSRVRHVLDLGGGEYAPEVCFAIEERRQLGGDDVVHHDRPGAQRRREASLGLVAVPRALEENVEQHVGVD